MTGCMRASHHGENDLVIRCFASVLRSTLTESKIIDSADLPTSSPLVLLELHALLCASTAMDAS